MLIKTLLILLALIGLAVPIAASLGWLGLILQWTDSPMPLHRAISDMAWQTSTDFLLVAIPMFVMMGEVLLRAGITERMYDGIVKWLGWLPGGLMHSNIGSSALFAATSGSSVATAATIGTVAVPQIKKRGYNERLFLGTVAAGGTLGILIPPSTGFVLYAILTEESIGKLFIAGIVPGLLLSALFVLVIIGITLFKPDEGPAGPISSMAEKLGASVSALPLISVILVSIGGIYLGVFTPVEAAGVGAFMVTVLAVVTGKLKFGHFPEILIETVTMTAMLYLIIIGAHVFGPFLALTHIPETLANGLESLGLGKYGTLLLILIAYIILGMFFDGLAMLVVTLPVVFPIITGLGFDPIWFGVIALIVIEMGLITPPVGINVFVVKVVAADVPMSTIFRGVFPCWLAMAACLLLLVLFPQIALFLPEQMK